MTNIPKTIHMQMGNELPDIEYVLKDGLVELIKKRVLEAYYDGFNQAHYSWMHPDLFPPKECQSAGEEYIAKREKIIEKDLSQLK
jgi:hypothetical protein